MRCQVRAWEGAKRSEDALELLSSLNEKMSGW